MSQPPHTLGKASLSLRNRIACARTLPDPSQQAAESLGFELHRAGGGGVHVRWAEHNAGFEIHHDATDEALLLLCPSVIRQPCMRRPPSYTHLIMLMCLAVGWLLLGCFEDVLQIFRTLRAYLGLECCWVDEGHATWQVLLTRGCMLASCWRAIVLLSQIMETFILTDFCSCYVKRCYPSHIILP
ncbi:uncharacterized protein [Aegilops tauschii subsp. strangulata]|uniref:uncharacterized protein isoform X3 n=1 Tax=Aegilops tauschii subsp. strangulata TaxID=200361 RepID=UPI003CC8A378